MVISGNATVDFKDGKIHILVATDIAARGIDVDDITQKIISLYIL